MISKLLKGVLDMFKTLLGGYSKLRDEHEYLKLLAAGLVSRFGDSLDAIAYSWMVYQITGSAAWLSVIFGVNALPTIILQPFAGVWLDYLNKKLVMVFCDFGRGLAVALTGLLFVTGRLSPWGILALTMINSTLEAFRIPAGVAIVPSLLKRENYEHATGLRSTLSRTFEIAGTMSAPAVIALLGLGGALFIDALTFFASGFILLFIKIPATENEARKERLNYWDSMRQGFTYFRTKNVVLAICLMGCCLNALAVPIGSLMTAYVKDSLHLGVEALTVSSLCSTIAMALGALIYPWLKQRYSSFALVIAGLSGVALSYGILSVIAYLPQATARLLALGGMGFILGVSVTQISMVVSVSFMQHVEREYLGRISALFNSMVMGVSPLVAFAIAPITTVLDIPRLYAIMGVLLAILTIAVSFNKTIKQLDQPKGGVTNEKPLTQTAALS